MQTKSKVKWSNIGRYVSKLAIYMDDLFQIWWRGSQIGSFQVTSSDMWYEDGTWHPGVSEAGKLFEILVSTFNASDVMKNPVKGTRIILRSVDSAKDGHALVMALEGNSLMIRRVFDEKAVQWLFNNVH